MAKSADDTPKSKNIRRLYLGCLFLALCLISLFVFIAAGTYRINNRLNGQIEDELDKIRSSGYPATLEELDRAYDAGPESREAGERMYRTLLSYTEPDKEWRDNVLFVGFDVVPDASIGPVQLNATQRTLEENDEYVRSLEILLDESETFRYPLDLTEGYDLYVPHLAAMRTAVRLLTSKAILQAHEGQIDQAISCLKHSFIAPNSLQLEPMYMSQLVRVACFYIILEGTEYIVRHFKLTRENIWELIESIEQLNFDNMAERVLIGERCFDVSEWTASKIPQEAWNDCWPEEGRAPAYFKQWRRTLISASLLDALHWYERLMEICDSPSQSWVQAMANFKRDFDSNNDADHMLSKCLFGHFVDILELELRTKALQDAARYALLGYVFQLENNRAPDSLEEIAAAFDLEVPRDPFRERSLSFHIDDNSIRVYSVGHDLDDDGGNRPEEGVSIFEDGDLTFSVPLIHGLAN